MDHLVKSNFLASLPFVVLFALAGRINIDFENEEIAFVKGRKIFLRDLWPSSNEVFKAQEISLKSNFFKKNYENIFSGDKSWEKINAEESPIFKWSINSTYIKKPPFLEKKFNNEQIITNARPLLILGDSITTDHISPAGVIKENSEAANYLSKRQVKKEEFNSFGARRGNHEVMIRGTFANVRINNLMVEKDGGYTKHFPSGF